MCNLNHDSMHAVIVHVTQLMRKVCVNIIGAHLSGYTNQVSAHCSCDQLHKREARSQFWSFVGVIRTISYSWRFYSTA